MDANQRTELLREIKSCLQTAFGPRLRGVVLYGSEARGEATDDSDIDVLMLLEGPIRLGKDIRAGVDALYPLQLRVGRVIEAIPADADTYRTGVSGFYREVRAEGIHL